MISRIIAGELQTNCWIVPLPGKDCIVIDPGGGGKLILARLEKLRLCPRYIAITHAHFDHLAALPFLAASFPKADIAVHQAEAGKLGPYSLENHKKDFIAAGLSSYGKKLWNSMPEASILLKDGDCLGPYAILHLPGHSPGSMALLLVNEKEKNLFSGDTLFRSGIGRTDLPGGNKEQLIQSLRRLLSLDEDVTVYPGHGPDTTIRKEKAALSSIILNLQ